MFKHQFSLFTCCIFFEKDNYIFTRALFCPLVIWELHPSLPISVCVSVCLSVYLSVCAWFWFWFWIWFNVKFNLNVKISFSSLSTRVNNKPPEKIHDSCLDHFMVLTFSQSPSSACTYLSRLHSLNTLHVYWSGQPRVFWHLMSLLLYPHPNEVRKGGILEWDCPSVCPSLPPSVHPSVDTTPLALSRVQFFSDCDQTW